jgi:hypothetical protein
MPASEHLAGPVLAINPRECPIGATALGRFLDGKIDLAQPLVEIGAGVSLDFDPRREGYVLGVDGRLCQTLLAHMGGPRRALRLACPVRLLTTTGRAIERIAPGRLKRDATNYTAATLHPAITPKVPHVAILAKAAGVYARRFAFGAKEPALTVLTVQVVAITTEAAGVYARRFAFDAKVPALAVADKRGGFEHPLLICNSCSGTPLMIAAHIASPTHALNEIGAGYAAPWTLCGGSSGTSLMVVAHIASPTHALNETDTEGTALRAFIS